MKKRVSVVSITLVRDKDILYSPRRIGSPSDSIDLFRGFLEDSDKEKFIVAGLDTKNQPTVIEIVSVGSINSSIVHPREVFKSAILSNSASIIMAHNHPSGDTTPSEEDKNITNRLIEAGKILGIQVLDHVILGHSGSYFSFKDKGLI